MSDSVHYLATIKRAFDEHYSEGSDVWTNDKAMRSVLDLVLNEWPCLPRSSALDIGCGAGHDLLQLSRHYQHASGIDLHSHAEWPDIRLMASNIDFFCGDFLDFSGYASYDLILDNGCFHHQHESLYVNYLYKVYSLLSENGLFVLTTFANPGLDLLQDANGRLFRYFEEDEISSYLLQSGMYVCAHRSVLKTSALEHGTHYRVTVSSKGGARI